MRSPSPAFSFYPKDWLSDANVTAMTFDEQGIYVRLLCHYWLEGTLPASEEKLARLLGMPVKRFARAWVALQPCFRVEGDRLVQKRVETEREKQEAFRDSQANKGKMGGRPKAPVKPDESRGFISANPALTPPSPSPVRTLPTNQPARANPLLGHGDRPRLETECLQLVRRMTELTGELPEDVIARASAYEGQRTTKLNPASMSDDRLLNTVRDLRADVAAEEKRHGTPQPVRA